MSSSSSPVPSGAILVDKPEGPTSHDVVASVRAALGGIRVGHTGTLDPFASGLLVLLVGRATRLARFLADDEKRYSGEVRFGFATDTDDRTGRPLAAARPPAFDLIELDRALASLTGEIEQLPPAYSARKQGGVPLYRIARRGGQVTRQTAPARVSWESVDRPEPDRLKFIVRVSSGTYVRALARDLGEKLGCGAHLDSLRRLSSGGFLLEQACPFPAPSGTLTDSVLPLESLPLDLPTLCLGAQDSQCVCDGRAIRVGCSLEGWVRLLDPAGRLLAIAEAEVPQAPPGPADPAPPRPSLDRSHGRDRGGEARGAASPLGEAGDERASPGVTSLIHPRIVFHPLVLD